MTEVLYLVSITYFSQASRYSKSPTAASQRHIYNAKDTSSTDAKITEVSV